MHLRLFEDTAADHLAPITRTRLLSDVRPGLRTLGEIARDALADLTRSDAPLTLAVRAALADVAAEVLSPSDRRRDVLEKVADYLSGGVKAVWLADYEEGFVTVFRSTAVPKIFGNTATLTGDDYLPDFSCSVAKLFLFPGEPRPEALS